MKISRKGAKTLRKMKTNIPFRTGFPIIFTMNVILSAVCEESLASNTFAPLRATLL